MYEGLRERATASRERAIAGGPLVVAHGGNRYVLTPTVTKSGEFYWSITDREGWEHRFTGNTRKAARANLVFWLNN